VPTVAGINAQELSRVKALAHSSGREESIGAHA